MMNKRFRGALLLLMLLLPVSAFVFLHMFGENRYTLDVPENLKVYNPKSAGCDESTTAGTHTVPDFAFTNQAGNSYGSQDLEGKIYVVDFFFTRCPNICIEMTSELLRVQDKFKDRDDFRLVSVSVNPEYDTAGVLQEYAGRYGADPKLWNFLTGPKDDIYELARCGYFIVAKPAESDPNDFIHADKFVLVDKEKRIRGYYSGTDREDVDRLIAEAQVLMHEYANN